MGQIGTIPAPITFDRPPGVTNDPPMRPISQTEQNSPAGGDKNPAMLNTASVYDPDQFTSFFRPNGAKITVASRTRFTADLTLARLPRVRISRNVIRAPGIYHTVLNGNFLSLNFVTNPHAPIQRGKQEIDDRWLGVWTPHSGCHTRTPHGFYWGSLTIPVELYVELSHALYGREIIPITAPFSLVAPDRDAMERLQQVHRYAVSLIRRDPKVLDNSEAARSLDNRLLREALACLVSSSDRVRPCTVSAEAVMRQFEEQIEAAGTRPLYLLEVLLALRISERTLRRHCQEQLGMGPHEYLLRRRMMLAHRALLWASSGKDTVQRIALDHGFPSRHRFSRLYREQFGELPSVTLGGK